MIDRTDEFQSCVKLAEQYETPLGPSPGLDFPIEQNEFSKVLSRIADELKSTGKLNEKFSELVSRKNPQAFSLEIKEIGEMYSSGVKKLQMEISILSSMIEWRSKKVTQLMKHRMIVVDLIQKIVARINNAHQASMQQRMAVLKEIYERRKQYSHTKTVSLNMSSDSPLFGQNASNQFVPKGVQVQTKFTLASQQSKDVVPSTSNNSIGLRRRPQAVTSIQQPTSIGNQMWQVQEAQNSSKNRLDEAKMVENILGELGQMFSKFTTLVAQQDELVIHIEDDIEMAQNMASEGQTHLSNYYKTISGNRGLIIKILFLMAFFVWLFTIYM